MTVLTVSFGRRSYFFSSPFAGIGCRRALAGFGLRSPPRGRKKEVQPRVEYLKAKFNVPLLLRYPTYVRLF